MKPDLLLMQAMLGRTENALAEICEVQRLFAAPDRDAFFDSIAPRIRAVATGGTLGLPRKFMDRLPALEIIAINGIGTDAVDLVEARKRGVRVTTTPDVLTDDVADMAMTLMLAAFRRLCEGDRFVRAGRWPSAGLPVARRVTGKRLGILGLGRIGRAIARRAEAFGMPISYTDLRPAENVNYRFVSDLVELAGQVDALVVAASGGAGSKHLVDTAVLNALGPEGLLINVARGSVVDETALVAALAEGRLGGAGLDVFADEPRVPEALWGMEQVVLQPHRASATLETRADMGDVLVANLTVHFAGQIPSAAVA
jgi:lactate dehydrogenase-like 2-hydroxyacid dehydrogenase